MTEIKYTSRKEREREFKRNEILSAALKLFANKGFENTTLDEIAEAAEFGKGTLYNYFQNKEDIYSALLESIMEEFMVVIRKLDVETTNLQDFLRQLGSTMLKYFVANKNIFFLLLHLRMQPYEKIKNILTDKMKRSQAESDLIHERKVEAAIKRKEIGKIEPKKVSAAYRGLFFSYLFSIICCKEASQIDVEAEAEFLVNFVMFGLTK